MNWVPYYAMKHNFKQSDLLPLVNHIKKPVFASVIFPGIIRCYGPFNSETHAPEWPSSSWGWSSSNLCAGGTTPSIVLLTLSTPTFMNPLLALSWPLLTVSFNAQQVVAPWGILNSLCNQCFSTLQPAWSIWFSSSDSPPQNCKRMICLECSKVRTISGLIDVIATVFGNFFWFAVFGLLPQVHIKLPVLWYFVSKPEEMVLAKPHHWILCEAKQDWVWLVPGWETTMDNWVAVGKLC